MNTRVMLLLMAAGLFLVVRSGDRRYQQHQRALEAIGHSGSSASLAQPGMLISQNSQAGRQHIAYGESCRCIAQQLQPDLSLWSPVSAECFPDASGLYGDRLSADSQIELTNHRTALHHATTGPSDAEHIDVCIDGCLELPNSLETPAYADPFLGGGTVLSLPAASLPVTVVAVKACKPTTTAAGQDLISRDKSKRVAGSGLPLPSDISPGDYRVVNNRGAVHLLTLTDSDLSHQQASSRTEPRPSYTVIEGRLQWYFIRIDIDAQTLEPSPAEQGFDASTAALEAVRWLEADVARTTRKWSAAYRTMIDRLAAGQRSAIDHLHSLTTSIADTVRRIELPPRISSGRQNDRRL